MAEFSERELKIIHAMTILQNPLIKDDAPADLKRNIVTATLAVRGLEFNEAEIIDLIQGVISEQKLVLQMGLGAISKMKINGTMIKEALPFGKAKI